MNPEILGIGATVFVLLSFLMQKPHSIRMINIIGAFLYCLYGGLIGSFSTVLLNAALILIHLCFLLKKKVRKPHEKPKQNL